MASRASRCSRTYRDSAVWHALNWGSLKALRDGIGQALLAPGLEELMLIPAVAIAPGDAERVRDHPTLQAFEWFAEDVPRRIAGPMLTAVDKPKTRAMHAWEWLNQRDVDNDACEDDLSALSEPIRAGAIVEPNGGVRWPLALADSAIGELAGRGAVILGLDLWPDQPEAPTEIPFWAYGSGVTALDVEPALAHARQTLREHPILAKYPNPTILVTWTRSK